MRGWVVLFVVPSSIYLFVCCCCCCFSCCNCIRVLCYFSTCALHHNMINKLLMMVLLRLVASVCFVGHSVHSVLIDRSHVLRLCEGGKCMCFRIFVGKLENSTTFTLANGTPINWLV